MKNAPFFIQPLASSQDLAKRRPFQDHSIEIWSLSLGLLQSQLRVLEKLHHPEEAQRANKFYFIKDRNQFVMTRGILYQLLSHYLKKPPMKISLDYNEFGKPSTHHEKGIFFNLSHSEDLVLLAFSKTFLIGIDIEYMDTSVDIFELAKYCLTQKELQFLEHQDRKEHVFFEYWTLKEALMKGVGSGFSIEPQSIEISFEANTHLPKLTHHTRPEFRQWKLYLLDPPAPNYVASIAIYRPNSQRETPGYRLPVNLQSSRDRS